MHTKLRLVFSITILFLSFYASAQREYWEKETARNSIMKKISERFKVQEGQVFSFNENLFKEDLKTIAKTGKSSKVVYFPDEEGKMVGYRISESPVLSPALAKKYPQIKSYTGYGISNKADKIRFSVSHKDVQAMIMHKDGRENSFIQKASDNRYVLYSRDTEAIENSDFVCATKDKVVARFQGATSKPVDEQVLRKYRLAVSATAEYTAYHGGTITDALAAINATITRVNAVFETDLAVTLELIADTDKVIYTDTATDPYSGSLGSMGNEAQDALTDEIGEANYDIGHVFHEGVNGGNAGFIGAICVDNRKGSAYASSLTPEGDNFDLDFVAHEMGHQLGANHTWSHELEGTLVQVEPGSGTTIMGYAGITDVNDVAPNGDDYFHYFSIEQIIENLKTKSCGELVPISNNPPAVNAVQDYIIPKSTAFVLTGSATDADTDDVLTYSWEQIDNGVVTQATFGPTNPSGANFRSRPPTLEPTRYFPMLSRVIEGNLTQTVPAEGSAWETVSDVEREMNFAVTVRDNAPGGGQVVSELVNILVVNGAGPFTITSQATNEIYVAGATQEIVWNVAGTDASPVNTETVDIFLSTDGGLTFPIPLAEGVSNDGVHEIIVPGLPTNEARIMVKAADNIFFAVNASDFTIEASEIVMNFAELELEVCQLEDLTVPFTYETYLGFNEEVTFSVTNAPANLRISFTPETAIAGDAEVNLLFEDTENVDEGSYPIEVTATSASITKQIVLNLNVYDSDFPDVVMTAPANGIIDVSTGVVLEWEQNSTYTSYEVQVATDEAFANIVEVGTVVTNRYIPTQLENQTAYFWRVRPLNACGEGTFNTPFGFTTIQFNCDNKRSRDLPLTISRTNTPTIFSKIAFYEDLPVADINVNLNIEHSFLADLVVSLTSPSGTTVTLISNSCGELQNLEATFDDDAEGFICGTDPDTAIKGVVKPLGALSSFNGESILGEWILEVSDNAPSDGGALNGFSMDICVEGDFRPDEDDDGVFDDGDDLCLGTPEGTEVDVDGCPVYRFPSDNFSVSVQSESCRNNDDGSVNIEANLPLEYDISVTGNGRSITDSFTGSFSFSNLTAGVYSVCIDGSEMDIEYEEYCFEITVTQPEPLGVTSKISDDGKRVSISLQGAALYTIELNDETVQTDKSEITLALKNGKNELKISTNLQCQGVYEDSLFVFDRPVVFPNPFDAKTKVFLNAEANEVTIALFTLDGRLVVKDRYTVEGREVELDYTGLPSGVYLLKFQGERISGTAKVIKQ